MISCVFFGVPYQILNSNSTMTIVIVVILVLYLTFTFTSTKYYLAYRVPYYQYYYLLLILTVTVLTAAVNQPAPLFFFSPCHAGCCFQLLQSSFISISCSNFVALFYWKLCPFFPVLEFYLLSSDFLSILLFYLNNSYLSKHLTKQKLSRYELSWMERRVLQHLLFDHLPISLQGV